MAKEKIIFKELDRAYYDTSDMEGQMMRYRANSLPYKIGMLALVFSILGSFICFNSLAWNLIVFAKVLLNIAILLFGFLSLERVKAYSQQFSYILIGIGGVCVLRMFLAPLQIIKYYNMYLINPEDPVALNKLGPAVVGTPKLNSYLPQSGIFRGWTAFVLIAIAAALFITSGVIGVIKAKRYAKYMSTQDTTKGV